ncbi:phenylacetate-CoA ligase [Arboricoccus pini]|uniref:Phenylacetate-CoA ligase n=1 Tax=Arboricoccus pini TaxID=1963835 RepID=A0A212QQM3_9PROT|nr:phenylacetate--CoA ligase family protein [Arboricoccus pini]SNB61731.1 phenylacetate-CoA ligase [Arboricoccus pini]
MAGMKVKSPSLFRPSAEAPERGGTYYDRQEVRNHFEREQALFHALPGLLHHAIENAPFFKDHLRDLDPDLIVDRGTLATLPLMRRSQGNVAVNGPFCGWAATPKSRLAKIYASPGQIYDPEGSRLDYWRLARAMFAAEFKPGQPVLNSLSYHLTALGSMAESGARALGCPVIPAGDALADVQAQILADLEIYAYAGKASFLLRILREGRRRRLPQQSLQTALVIGDGLNLAAREEIRRKFGIMTFHAYVTTDLGLIAYETVAQGELLVDESVIVELVDPTSGKPVAAGRTGEVVVTAFNPDYPLIRFATGDYAVALKGESACGRTNMRIRLVERRESPPSHAGQV